MKIKIRFNKTRGQAGRGTVDHAWRVFANGKEYLCKDIQIYSPVTGEKDENGHDWNMVCEGKMQINRAKSLIQIFADWRVPPDQQPISEIYEVTE